MTYTVIYRDANDLMGTFTFVSRRHSKSYAWSEFMEEYAEEGQEPVVILPGHQIAWFAKDISLTQVA